MYQKLLFRRQYLLARVLITDLSEWKCLKVENYYLHVHPDLEVNQIIEKSKSIVLLGHIYDYLEPKKGNAEICADISASANNIEEFVSFIKRYAGCYAFILCFDNQIYMLHDARGLREIYYCTQLNQVICGSQPNIVAQFSIPENKPTLNKDLLDFYKNHLWDSRWVGDETYFDGVKHLLPNHYLHINKLVAYRYWPNKPIRYFSLGEAVPICCAFLQGILKAITFRHPSMMAVTAGSDSRTLLAASKDILDKIYFFINDHDLGQNNPDLVIPKKIFKSIGKSFHVHSVPREVDTKFKQIYLNNTFLSNEHLLPSIYNVYYKNHSEKMLILGVGEIGRTFYGKAPKQLESYRMAYKLGYQNCKYVLNQFEQLATTLLPVAKNFSVNPMALLYWEQRLGNWGAVRNSESNIAIEKIDPYNSHFLYETMLGVDEKYRFYGQTSCVLIKEMIRFMWPEMVDWPINPPSTLKENVANLLIKSGLYTSFKEMIFMASFIWHKIKRYRWAEVHEVP